MPKFYNRPDLYELVGLNNLYVMGSEVDPVHGIPVYGNGDEAVKRKDIKLRWKLPPSATVWVIDYATSVADSSDTRFWGIYIEFENIGTVENEEFCGVILGAQSIAMGSDDKNLSNYLNDNMHTIFPKV